MATYKLIQDVEADDKLLGPLSFRQFIYALIAVFMLYVSYLLYVHHGEILMIATIPVALFAGFLAYPFGKDQPTEVWALAKFRFFIKPRRRIWAQSGIKELVTINVPKKIEARLTNGLSQTEVQSRLQALANTIDSRGWAIKNVSNIYQNPLGSDDSSDRLISTSTLPQNVSDYDIPDTEDPYNEKYSPIAQQVEQLLSNSTSQHHQQLLDNLNSTRSSLRPAAPQVEGTVVADKDINLPAESVIESQLKSAYASSHSSFSNMHTLRDKVTSPKPAATTSVSTTSTKTVNPVIMNLSQRDDLNLNVISRQADQAMSKSNGSDEVVIALR